MFDILDYKNSQISRLNELFSDYCDGGWGEYEVGDDFVSIANNCDAYYGTAGKEAYYCSRIGLPVMVNVDLLM